MCDTNAWGEKSCGHSSDTLDREIMTVLLFGFMKGGAHAELVRGDIIFAIHRRGIIARVWPNWARNAAMVASSVSYRLQVLQKEGYIEQKWCGYWRPSSSGRLQDAYVRYEEKKLGAQEGVQTGGAQVIDLAELLSRSIKAIDPPRCP